MNRNKLDMEVLDQVLAVPKTSLSSEHAQIELSARSKPMGKQYGGQKKIYAGAPAPTSGPATIT